MTRKVIYVLGIGASTPVSIELALDAGYKIGGLYHYNDERTGEVAYGYSIIGSFDDLFQSDINGKHFLLSMGNMHIRKELTEKIEAKGGVIPTIIHSSALVSRFSKISDHGVLIDAMAIIQPDVFIGDGVIIRAQALICHSTSIESYVFVGPKSLVGARLEIREQAFIGQGAALISSKATPIGYNATIGAGAVVTKPVSPKSVVVGNPAKPMEGGVKTCALNRMLRAA